METAARVCPGPSGPGLAHMGDYPRPLRSAGNLVSSRLRSCSPLLLAAARLAGCPASGRIRGPHRIRLRRWRRRAVFGLCTSTDNAAKTVQHEYPSGKTR